ncbi:hypothetical protein IFM89_010629 [Coptis chinensis]|uniref:Uncharacterized protein n=1 Tax=Coptis chinensis TaxID=261450 RepID=A0A835INU2_9MAGN|nr:hypothetical protein IFM89_010629 [Coptis chinensis]
MRLNFTVPLNQLGNGYCIYLLVFVHEWKFPVGTKTDELCLEFQFQSRSWIHLYSIRARGLLELSKLDER